MKKYLLDTNICIFYLKGKYELDMKIEKVGQKNCFISEITVAELLYGAYHSKSQRHVSETHQFIEEFAVIPFAGLADDFAKRGNVSYPSAGAYVYDVIDSTSFPFKIYSTLGINGTVTQDREAGIAGRFGYYAPSVSGEFVFSDLDALGFEFFFAFVKNRLAFLDFPFAYNHREHYSKISESRSP